MPNPLDTPPTDTTLKLLPAYQGTTSISEALQTARGRRILWLEILLNDRLDFTPWASIIAKLRRERDALLVAQRYAVSPEETQTGAQASLAVSPQDTLLFLFKKTVELFCKDLSSSAR